MLLPRLSSVRGQLLLWYLGVLAAVLLALGAFQGITLGGYLRTATTDSMRSAAGAELTILGPCFVKSDADLQATAQSLAQLLGSHDTAVKIVDRNGAVLADHGLGPPGATHPLRLTASVIHVVIQDADPVVELQGSNAPTEPCGPTQGHAPPPGRLHRINDTQHDAGTRFGNQLLVAIPLGPPDHILGYAILGRSLTPTRDTLSRAELVFGLGAGVALLLTALVALPLINHALRPLRRVASTAESIAAGSLEKRANLPVVPDEIGRLGKAFDTMVDRLQDALTDAKDSEERMRHFLADASHELRTPLTVLRGTSQVLLRQTAHADPDLLQGLTAIHEESVRLSRLVDNLLTLSRLDEGEPLDPQPVEIHPFLQDFLERYGGAWPERSLALRDEALDGAVASIDPEALRRVLTNLVDNAARYSSPAGSITVSARADQATVRVAVSDEGPGLNEQEAERVFERFYRVGKSRSRRSGGTGLGLAIVAALTAQSNGRVELDTGPDRGTTVSVIFPRISSFERGPA